MNKLIVVMLSAMAIAYGSSTYDGGTLAPVILSGAIVKHSGAEITKKYPRKNCPVCKGTGKYLSGDGIKMVDCGYCEPETQSEVIHPEVKLYGSKNKCENPNCKCKDCKCKNCGCVPSVER
jgi:hypothetical protein